MDFTLQIQSEPSHQTFRIFYTNYGTYLADFSYPNKATSTKLLYSLCKSGLSRISLTHYEPLSYCISKLVEQKDTPTWKTHYNKSDSVGVTSRIRCIGCRCLLQYLVLLLLKIQLQSRTSNTSKDLPPSEKLYTCQCLQAYPAVQLSSYPGLPCIQ